MAGVRAGLAEGVATQAVATTAVAASEPAAAFAAIKAVYEQAVKEDKPELIEPLLDPQFTGVTFTAKEIEGYAGVKEFWEQTRGVLGEGGNATSELTVSPDVIMAHDIAIVHGSSRDILQSADKKFYKLTLRWTAIFRRTGGVWKVLRFQQSINPQNDLVLNSASRTAMWAGVISLVAGLAMGAAFMRFARSKPASPE